MNKPPLRIHATPFLTHWLALGAVLLILGSAIVIYQYFEHQNLKAREQARLLAQTKVVEVILSEHLSTLYHVLGDLSRNWSQYESENTLNARLNTLDVSMPGIRTLLVLDGHGNVLTSNRLELLGGNFSGRDYFRSVQQAPDPDTLYVSPPFTTVLGVYSLNVCRMIPGLNGEFAGLVSATLDPEFFAPLLEAIHYAPKMWASIVHSDGILFMIRPERDDRVGKNLAQPGTFYSMHLNSGREVNVYSGTSKLSGDVAMLALRTIQPTNLRLDKPLIVRVSRDLDSIYADWRFDNYWQSGMYFASVIASCMFLQLYHLKRRKHEERLAAAEKARRESENRLREMIDFAPIGIFQSTPQGSYITANVRLAEMYGYDSVSDLMENVRDIGTQLYVEPEEREALLDALNQGPVDRIEIRRRHKNGSVIWVSLSMRPAKNQEGHTIYYDGFARDITARKQAEAELSEAQCKLEMLSITDGLTGIANRRRFDEVLAMEHSRLARTGAELSLIMLDIDHFKAFNDTYGHIKGDDCLRQVAKIIDDAALRPADIAARYGGEEFACILPETDSDGAVIIAEIIRLSILSLSIANSGSDVSEYVTVSIGVATVRCSTEKSAVDIIALADEMLYRAKTNGRNRVICISTSGIALTQTKTLQDAIVQLAWNESFCCGHALIDSQHQALFRLSAKLLEMVISDCPQADVSATMMQLLNDISQHFHDEELILEEVAFPRVVPHALEHARLLDKCKELLKRVESTAILPGDVFQFLAHDVVMLHMLGADREFHPFTARPIETASSKY